MVHSFGGSTDASDGAAVFPLMIRRFLPKGTDFRKVTAAYIQRVETWINNYPREILGFETSGSLFERYVAEAA